MAQYIVDITDENDPPQNGGDWIVDAATREEAIEVALGLSGAHLTVVTHARLYTGPEAQSENDPTPLPVNEYTPSEAESALLDGGETIVPEVP